jgi:hypothetical protein
MCSGRDFIDERGVIGFSADGINQTIPVSHFGEIDKALIWLILTNPKGERADSNVGHLVKQYNVTGRENLSDEQIKLIFQHFNKYFQRDSVHPFFNPYMTLLNNLEVAGQVCTFQNGGICAVDVIKCPTLKDWQAYVRQNEGKKVWHNCIGHVRNPGLNHYLLKQIDNHLPRVLIFAQSTSGLIGVEYKGNSNGSLNEFANIKIFTRNVEPRRISISLGNNSQFNLIMKNTNSSTRLHVAIEAAINNFFRI